MNQLLTKKEKEKMNENYTTEKTEDNNISIDLENKIIKKSSKKKTKKREEEKNQLNNSLTDIQLTNENKTSNKSNSFEKQDMSEDMIIAISSNKKYHVKNKASSNISQNFSKHYKTMIEYENRRLEKIIRLRKYLENIEIKKLKPKPEISKYSRQLTSNSRITKDSIQRMREEEEKTKQKRKALAEKIKEERIRRKAEQDKKPVFKIKKIKNDTKFNKFYSKMIENDKLKKEKFAKFTEIVRDYEMRECVFQPNLTDFDENKYKTLNSNQLVHRLYDDELKKRVQKKKDLEKKYKPSFKPNLMKNSINFIKKHQNKKEKKKTGSIDVFGMLSQKDKRFNNSMQKRMNRNYNLKDTEKDDKLNVTGDNLDNKSVDNIYIEDKKTEIINNHKILKKSKNNTDKKEKVEKNKKQNNKEN